MATAFSIQKIVEYAATDMAGIVHHAEFFRYMEEVEHAFLRSVGLSVFEAVDGRRVSWPRVSCSFDFKKALRFEDVFELNLWIERLGDRSVTYRVDVTKDGELAAVGRSTSVCCEMTHPGEMRSIPIPARVRSLLETGPLSGTP